MYASNITKVSLSKKKSTILLEEKLYMKVRTFLYCMHKDNDQYLCLIPYMAEILPIRRKTQDNQSAKRDYRCIN